MNLRKGALMNKTTVQLHVSLHGDDSATGSKQKPFATLQRAQTEARKAAKLGFPVQVWVHEGTYYLSETLRFSPEDSGRADALVIYEAAPGEKVIISGAKKLDLQWSVHKGEIQQFKSIPPGLKLDQLFVNGRQMHMARYPNFNEHTRIMNGYAKDCIDPERVANWKNPRGGYVHAMHKHLWGDYRYRITGKDNNNVLALEGGWQNNRLMGMHDEYRYVENIFEELDAPGEWFYDEVNEKLYVYPYPDMKLEDADIEGVRLTHLFEFSGSEDLPVRHIRIKGFTFRHSARTFMDNREPLLRSDWTTYRGGAVVFKGTENCSTHDCTFEQLGGNAIFVDCYNRNVEIKGCHIVDVGANGIAFVGDPGSVRSPLFEYNERQKLQDMDQTRGPKTNDYPAQCLVEDCLISRVGRVEKQSAPVQISMSLDITIRHCSIYEVPRAGINISEGTFGGHVIEHCDVFDTVLETGDHGSFNSWGRDRYWLLEDVEMDRINSNQDEEDSLLPILDMVRPVTLRNNRWRCDYGWDIDLDDGSTWYHIYNNLCLGGGIKLREGFYRVCDNNVIVNNSFHPHVWFEGSRDRFQHNIVFGEYEPIRVPKPWGKACDRNLLHQAGLLEPRPAVRLQELSGADTNSVMADALFVDTANGNYQVRDDSPAIGLGFRNFSMDRFGVRKPELKMIARTPKLPTLGDILSKSGRLPQQTSWDRCKIKNIVGMGEVSAAGLPGETGVIIESIPWGSWQMEKGIQVADVVLKINGHKVDTVDDLLRICQSVPQGTRYSVVLFRGQREVELTL
ncbi:PDZ domain-containing protein [Cohnella herbarum]|uniref:PDZ domain-containing protein n=1 Tax=Cohnella herbarum TaxID=2728023 RepID=A0A7Z2VIT4_9BACL|nr:PDZ domain-containing protein [Cohnella herbarum]QJD84041.1 PDZ domain-containing protein [Cohnella herbarum]